MKLKGNLVTNKIDDINKKLEDLLNVGSWQLDRIALFNLGVELGRELEKLKVDEYISPVWESINNKKDHAEKVRKACEKIEDFIATLVKKSVKVHIEQTGSWSISKDGGYRLEKFDDEIVKQYNIQVLNCTMETYGGEFTVSFFVEGELRKLLKKFNIYEQFTVRIYNDTGEEDQTVYKVSDVNEYIDSVSLVIRERDEWALEKFDECLNEISKPFLFLIMTGN